MISVRKILFSVFCGVLTLLIMVGLIGLLQLRLTNDYNQIIEKGGTILFQFNMVREHITRSMLEENWEKLNTELDSIDTLHTKLTTLLDSSLIPNEYKLALINQVDLPGIVMLSRQLLDKPGEQAVVLKLQDHLRLMSDQLMRFDRVLINEMKTQQVRFQNIAIGVLTIITAGISLMLLFLYQKAFAPLIRLSRRLHGTGQPESLPVDPKACREIGKLTTQVNHLLQNGRATSSEEENPMFSPEKMNSFSNHLNGIINYTQLLIDEGQLGQSDKENKTILAKILSSGETMTSLLHEKK